MQTETGTDEKGESVLENELAADRAFEDFDEGKASVCPKCRGSRLNEIARHVRVQGQTIDHFISLAASDALGASWANCVSAAIKRPSQPISSPKFSSV